MSLFHLLILKKLKLLSLIFVASNINQNPLQKASIMYLNKEATNKRKSLKYFLLIRKKSIVLKIFWKKMSFLEIKKGSYHQQGYFPQEYISVLQSGHSISTLKAGDYAIYIDYVILGQLILANNCPEGKWGYTLCAIT